MLSTTSSQKQDQRPISFLLDKGQFGALTSYDMAIRPEELVRTEPSRLSVQQTLGGAWADNFGRGIATINISGHTGWRGAPNGDDGMALFKKLNDTVFNAWHDTKQRALQNMIDPSTIKLYFADALDDFVWEVATASFTLRRSKSRPLLMQYNIALTVLDARPKLASQQTDDELLGSLGLDSLTNAINAINGVLDNVQGFLNKYILGPLKTFCRVVNAVIGKVMGVVNRITGMVSSVYSGLLKTAQTLALAGRNIAQLLAFPSTLLATVKADLMNLGAAFSNAFCVLTNCFKVQRSYPQYGALYGSSNCSSTAGGSPPSQYVVNGSNPFADVAPTVTLPVQMTAGASAAAHALASTDVVNSGMSQTAMVSHLNAINNGTVTA